MNCLPFDGQKVKVVLTKIAIQVQTETGGQTQIKTDTHDVIASQEMKDFS